MAGPLENSDGSAEWACGTTNRQVRLLCAVNGPLEPKLRDELPQKATLSIHFRSITAQPKIRERLIQDRLHASVLSILRREFLPRSLVRVDIQLLQTLADEHASLVAELAEGINVATLALIDAGVPLSGLACGVSYVMTASAGLAPAVGNGSPTDLEDVTSTHAVIFRFVGDEAPQIIVCESLGSFTEEDLAEVLKRAEQDAATVSAELRKRTTSS